MIDNNMNKITETLFGPMFINTNDICIGKSLDIYGEFYRGEMDFLKPFIPQTGVCIDVGANIGVHTLFFAKQVGPNGLVVSFEPQMKIFQLLCATVAINDLLNVETFLAAAGEKNGLANIPAIDYNQPGNFGMVAISTQGRTVPMFMLDHFVLNRIDLIKIDTEGFESNVLNGAKENIAKHRPFIYAENKQEKSLELVGLLKYLKYRVYEHSVPGWNPDNMKKCSENIHGNYVETNIFCVPVEKSLSLDLKELL